MAISSAAARNAWWRAGKHAGPAAGWNARRRHAGSASREQATRKCGPPPRPLWPGLLPRVHVYAVGLVQHARHRGRVLYSAQDAVHLPRGGGGTAAGQAASWDAASGRSGGDGGVCAQSAAARTSRHAPLQLHPLPQPPHNDASSVFPVSPPLQSTSSGWKMQASVPRMNSSRPWWAGAVRRWGA